jgi:hypothetical protein
MFFLIIIFIWAVMKLNLIVGKTDMDNSNSCRCSNSSSKNKGIDSETSILEAIVEEYNFPRYDEIGNDFLQSVLQTGFQKF